LHGCELSSRGDIDPQDDICTSDSSLRTCFHRRNGNLTFAQDEITFKLLPGTTFEDENLITRAHGLHSGTLAAPGIDEASESLRGTLAAQDRITISQCLQAWRPREEVWWGQTLDCVAFLTRRAMEMKLFSKTGDIL